MADSIAFTKDQSRGKTKRLEKYIRNSTKKINCNRAICKDKVSSIRINWW
jgi:hypothetical protein